MKQLCGIFDFETGQYYDRSKGSLLFVNDDYELYWCGKIESNKREVDGKLLCEIYREHGDKITEQIQGIYILVVYDKTKKELRVFQDRTTSSQTFYYTLDGNQVYLGTSLKWILWKSKIPRKLNEDVIEEFLLNGFIYGKETLIDSIYKIASFTSLLVRKDVIEEVSASYPVRNMTKGEALDAWEAALSDAVVRCFADEEEIHIPLSSGYDSNYIAYIADTRGHKPIHAYSIGGRFGKNELPVVRENVSAYNHIQLNTALTNESTLSNLPDIVWRLEGAVYEVGVFLQYELSRLVSECGKKHLICGECADQVMNKYYLESDRLFVKKEGKPVHYEFSEYPYIFGSYLILKKNGILSNSFGIETEYPYLDEDFVAISHSLRHINAKDKRIHIANCQERLPESVVNNMSKIGGATDIHSLFGSKEEWNRFILSIQRSEFYQKHESLIRRVSYAEKEKQTGIKKMKTQIRNILLDCFRLNRESRKQAAYFFEELELREYMCCAYLMLFDKLFISGEYDDQLDCESISVDLHAIMAT